jgi:hypothetical protein
MKRTVILALAMALSTAVFAKAEAREATPAPQPQVIQAGDVMQLAPFVLTNNLSWEDAAMVLAISRATKMSPQAIIGARSLIADGNLMNLGPALLLATTSGRSPESVLGMVGQGAMYASIADTLGVPATLWNPFYMPTTDWTNTDVRDAMWYGLLHNSLYVPTSEFAYFDAMGLPMEQLIVASVLGREFNLPASTVQMTYADHGDNWQSVINPLTTMMMAGHVVPFEGRAMRFVSPGPTTVSPIAPILNTHGVNWGDAATAVVLAQALGISTDQVLSLRGDRFSDMTLMDLAPAIVIAWHGERPLTEIVDHIQHGVSYTALASHHDVPNTFWNINHVPTATWTNDQFVDNLWQSILFDSFYVPTSEFTYFRTNDLPLEHLLVASVLGRQFNLPARNVVAMYGANGNDWTRVENFYLDNPHETRVYRVVR